MADDEKDKRDYTDPSGEGKPKDLRYSSLEDRNIRIDRNLDGSGHLTRGDKTKMSSLNFSSKHPARTERDPDFEFRPAPAKPVKPPEAAAPPVPPVAAPPVEAPSLATRIKKLFGM
ncbi:MAG: hypothetical protein ABI647_27100 [Gemmatimonadota bacterium]